MNIEALEKDDLYCSVRETNGKIRVLEKKEKDYSFKEILDLENKIEDIDTSIELIAYNIDNIKRKNKDKIGIYFIQCIAIILTLIIFHQKAPFNILTFGFSFEIINILITGLIPLNNKKMLEMQEEKASFIEEKEELQKNLENIKRQVQVREYIAIDSNISDKDINHILAPAYHNRSVGNVYNLYSLKVLKYELLRYIERKNGNKELKQNIEEIEVEYPGIPKILKKNRN